MLADLAYSYEGYDEFIVLSVQCYSSTEVTKWQPALAARNFASIDAPYLPIIKRCARVMSY